MKTKILIGLLGISLAACSSTDEPAGSATPGRITIQTTINGSHASRVTTAADGAQSFTDGDVISIYSWIGSGDAVPETLIVDNAQNTLTDGIWVSDPQMLWKSLTDPHYFLGVYPARAITDFTADPFTLGTDETANDLLVAVNTSGLVASENPVIMAFDHVMAKLVVNLTFRDQWSETPTVSAITASAATAATINYLADTQVAATGDNSDVALTTVSANTKYSAIMVPQDACQTVSITIDGKDFVYDKGSAIALEAGKITTLNLAVGRNKITVESLTINDWAEGETISGGEAL
jgi:hypothetical protein